MRRFRLKDLKEWLFFDVPEELEEEFIFEVNRTNLSRAKITCMAFLIIESMIVPVFALSHRGDLLEYPNVAYLVLYFVMIAAMSVYLFAFVRLEKDVRRNANKIQAVGASFLFFTLLWCAGISLLDQLSSGQIIVYGTAIISVAVFPFFGPYVLLFVYLAVHALFLTLLPVFQKAPAMLYGNFVNATANLIIAWIISRVLYKSKNTEFTNKFIIEKQNKEFKDINQRLEEANRQLEVLSYTDGLTGLLNRRRFGELLGIEWNRCKRHALPISLIMVDIDYFKQYNDFYGHLSGDVCIVKVAGILAEMARRSSDIVARYGGEEFILALPYMERAEALALAEKIRKRVEGLLIPHEKSEAADHVTISLGACSVVPSDRGSTPEFLQCADKALYRAKSEGRNRTASQTL